MCGAAERQHYFSLGALGRIQRGLLNGEILDLGLDRWELTYPSSRQQGTVVQQVRRHLNCSFAGVSGLVKSSKAPA
jgi:hypothetical protein